MLELVSASIEFCIRCREDKKSFGVTSALVFYYKTTTSINMSQKRPGFLDSHFPFPNSTQRKIERMWNL